MPFHYWFTNWEESVLRISQDSLKEMNSFDLESIKKCVNLQQGDKVNVIAVSDKGEKKIQKAKVIKKYDTYVLIEYTTTRILEAFLYIDIYMNKNPKKV